MNLGKLKTLPEDFIVVESLSLKNEPPYNFHYYLLEKKGYTTFEAIDQIINHFKLQRNLISYAGLKDEDGITKQFFSSQVKLDFSILENFNTRFKNDGGSFIYLSKFGAGSEKINTGELNGNAFRIIIRQLDERFANALAKTKKYSTFFINYYGPQRFGIPNSPKNTHLIGECLIKQDYSTAIELIKSQKNDLGSQANSYTGNLVDFFSKNVTPELIAFFKSSFYSYQWNNQLKNVINDNFSGNYNQQIFDNISYYFLSSWENKIHFIKLLKNLEHTRVTHNNGSFIDAKTTRNTVVQINFVCHKVFEDNLTPGYWAIDCSFYLPSGCYATIAIPQTLEDFSNEVLK